MQRARGSTRDRDAAERRAAARTDEDALVLFVRELGGADACHGRLRNLSVHGACVTAPQQVPPGDEVFLGLFLKGRSSPLVVRGLVVRVEPAEAGHVIGIRFPSGGLGQRQAVGRLGAYLLEQRLARKPR